MTPTVIKTIKTVFVAVAAAGFQKLIESLPDLLPIVPPKYASVVSLLMVFAALYHKAPPSGPSNGAGAAPTGGNGLPPAGAAVVCLVLGLLCGAFLDFVIVHAVEAVRAGEVREAVQLGPADSMLTAITAIAHGEPRADIRKSDDATRSREGR